MKKTALFRRHVMEEKILMVPVAHDALCARIAQKTGFKAVCSAGYANTAALLGKPDVSLLGLSEMVDCAWRIADATELPVLADGDTGHGNVTNVVRTVRLHEKAGVAALIIEDQVAPKRCGHMSGKQVIPVFEMEAKIKAAVDARIDPDFVIVARTDAIAVNGLNDALERAHRYVNAGADFIFVEAPETVEQMSAITREIRVPTLANMVPGGKTPVLTAERLQEIGFSLAIYPTAATYVIAQAMSRFFDALLRTGDLENLQDRMILFDDFNDLVGLAEIQQTEEKYYGHAK